MTQTNDVIISVWIASPAHACIGWVAMTKNVLIKLVYYIILSGYILINMHSGTLHILFFVIP